MDGTEIEADLLYYLRHARDSSTEADPKADRWAKADETSEQIVELYRRF